MGVYSHCFELIELHPKGKEGLVECYDLAKLTTCKSPPGKTLRKELATEASHPVLEQLRSLALATL